MKKLLITFSICAFAFAAEQVATTNASLKVEKANLNDLHIMLESKSDVYGLQFDLNYDDSKIQLTEDNISSSNKKVIKYKLAKIGFGTWSWGNKLLWGYIPEEDDQLLEQTFQVAINNGLNFIDTADSYGIGKLNGRSEVLLGKYLSKLTISFWTG